MAAMLGVFLVLLAICHVAPVRAQTLPRVPISPPTTAICTFQHGWEIRGNDISSSTTLSAEECCALCNTVFNCHAFTFFWATNECVLKSSVGTDVTMGQATTGFAGENLAFEKPTELSSTYLDLDGILDVSDNGVDGSTWGRWFCTERQPVSWWRVDLLGSYMVGRVELFNRICCLGDEPCSTCWWRMSGVQVWISNSPVSFDADGSECDPGELFDYGGGSYGFPFVKECNLVGSYVWVVLFTYQHLHLSEVRVLRKDFNNTPLPPSPTPPPPPTPCSPSLPEPAAICSLQYGWVIWGNDLPNYSGVTATSPEECCNLCNQVSACRAFTFFEKTQKCALKSSVGTNVTAGQGTTGFAGENLAFQKPTEMSDTFGDVDGILDVSSYGVDGSTWGRWFCTEAGAYKWWRVDLLGPYMVGRVELFNRICCLSGVPCSICWLRLTGVQVWITNSSLSYSTDGSECNPDAIFDFAGGSYGFPFVKECNRVGRYVWVVLPAYQYLHLSEVRVVRKGPTPNVPPTILCPPPPPFRRIGRPPKPIRLP